MSPATITVPKPEHLDVHCEGDLVVARIRGPYDESVARYLECVHSQQGDLYGYRLALVNGRETTTITPEARQLMSKLNPTRRDRMACAVVGASFATKTVAKLLVRGLMLLTRLPVPLAIDFFDTEAEARAWLDEQRPWLKDPSP
jgi:hypothetical protein